MFHCCVGPLGTMWLFNPPSEAEFPAFPAVASAGTFSSQSLKYSAHPSSRFAHYFLYSIAGSVSRLHSTILPPHNTSILLSLCSSAGRLWPSQCCKPSSLCASRRQWSDPVSADGIFQESCYFLTVILRRQNQETTSSIISFYWVTRSFSC